MLTAPAQGGEDTTESSSAADGVEVEGFQHGQLTSMMFPISNSCLESLRRGRTCTGLNHSFNGAPRDEAMADIVSVSALGHL